MEGLCGGITMQIWRIKVIDSTLTKTIFEELINETEEGAGYC